MPDPVGIHPRLGASDEASVEWFSRQMLAKLRVNAHKAHWSCVTERWLLSRLRQEAYELSLALEAGDSSAVIREAADVANFAMMIADNARGARR